MALTSILAPVGNSMIFQVARGNTGVVSSITSGKKNMFYIPEVTGGGGGEHSYTF